MQLSPRPFAWPSLGFCFQPQHYTSQYFAPLHQPANRPIFSPMRLRATTPFVLLFLVWVCFGTTLLRAQTPSGSGSCPPSNESQNQSTDEARPKAIIDELIFDGPIHLPYSDLEPEIEKFNQLGRSPDSAWLDEFLEVAIRGAWQDRGYFKVLVDGRAEPHGSDAANQHFSVVLHVDEGLQYRLGEISFLRYPDTDVTQVSSTVAGRSQMDASKGSESGSADTDETANNSSRPTLRRRRSSNDGESVSASTIGPPAFPVVELRSLIPLQEGDILSAEKLREGLDALRKLYGSHGYIDFTPTPETEVDDDRQIVSIHFVLDEQPQYRIGKIEIVGLGSKTENALIWKLKPGDLFNDDLLKQFFVDNQALLPEGSSELNSEFRRNTKDGIADIKLKFRSCPPE